MSEEQLIQTPCIFGENGNFLLERELGMGGMGGVYLGRDKMLDRPVAVKVMLKEYGCDEEFVERFKKEAQAAARLIHPNIAQIYSYGIADGMPYISMELVAGGSLYQIMRNSGSNSDVPRILKICEQVAQALRCAADQGLVHGDIKPENILLDSNGNAKLVDFGLAAMQKDTDEIWGTPYYIAPEKVRKETVDYRADIYSLGGTLYHALCGVAPFEGDDASAVVRKRFEYIPRKPSEIRSDLSPQIDALVMKMLAFNPADRYPTFEALLADFKAVMTVGLSSSQILTPSGSPSKASNLTSTGKKKLTLKAKRLTIKTPSSSGEDDEGGEEGGQDHKPAGKKYKFKNSDAGSSSARSDYDDAYDEEEGGNVGGKIALFAGIIIGVVALVVGGLWYITSQDAKEKTARGEAAVRKRIDEALDAFSKIRVEAVKAEKEVDEIFEKTAQRTEETSSKLTRLFEGTEESRFFADVKPPKSKELLDAEKALNPPAPEAASDAAGDAKTAGSTPAVSATAQTAPSPKKLTEEEKNAKIQEEIAAGKRFPPPVGDEADPMSPEGIKYLERKKEWEAAQKEKAAAEAAASAAPAVDTNSSAQAVPEVKVPRCVGDMQKHWGSTYTILANTLKIKKQVRDIISEIDLNSGKIEYTDANKERFVALANSLNGRLDAVFSQIKEVKTEAKKLQRALERFYQEVNSDEIKKKERAKAQELAEKKKKAEEERIRLEKERLAALLVEENEKAKSSFDKLVAEGALRRLYWEGAERELKALAESFQTPEARRRVYDIELKKVHMMKSVQDIFISNMNANGGYVFSSAFYKNKFLNKRVVSVDKDKIVLVNKNGKGVKSTLMWQSVYADYPLLMNELWNKYILKGRENGVKKLSLKEWAEAQLGFAMTLKLICSNVDGADQVSRLCATEAVKKLPNYKALAAETFPEIDFSVIEAEAAANDL